METSEIAKQYEKLIRAWAELHHELEKKGNVKQANKVFDAAHACAKKLRDSEKGRQSIEGLMSDPDPGVRLMSASDSLAWDAPEGIKVLTDLSKSKDAPPQFSFPAQITLEEYHAGRLNLDW